ncbi:immune-associated nucleotide-binding protein 9-like [Bidens hawaiensis]|uniref:immune-associated nucleotide-binding protein 9-like n=1 Tax=Bidens hawaiensis TaxID=980011 RepID=UPI00404B4878
MEKQNDKSGIVGSSVDTEFTEEIANTVGDGVHAFLVVVSIRSRFSQEEEAAISRLQLFFGSQFYDYMILVFTGGDQLDEDETLEDFLHDCPENLKEILDTCENRCVLFDNKTEDQVKRSDQVDKLLSYVNMVSRKNGGKLYKKEMFDEWKKQAVNFQAMKEPNQSTEPEISMLTNHLLEGHVQQLFEKVEQKLMETTSSLQRQLAAERVARLKAEEDADATQKEADEEICYIKEQIFLFLFSALNKV